MKRVRAGAAPGHGAGRRDQYDDRRDGAGFPAAAPGDAGQDEQVVDPDTLLVPLSEAPGGVLRSRDLGRMVGWERSRVSHQVTRMEKRGLVAREECSEDARGSMVRLTDAGRMAIVAAAPAHVAAVRRHFFGALTDAELDVIGPALERVLDRLPDNDG